ncbi:hypothetical protein M422DRAFT_26307 [Sphaerobolus stellatus SS14]|nr:hypothetical protein M422DRAFT_26307 [Sphaerobolus stellatus SS14]
MPKSLKKYCETCRIMWECWCGLYTPEPVSIQFYGDYGYIYDDAALVDSMFA